MNSTATQEIARRQQDQDARNERLKIFGTFFGVSHTELMDDGSMKLRFDAQAADGSSEEKMFLYLLPANTPETNTELLRRARERWYWYGQKRAETEGIPVPPPVPTAS